MLIIPPSKKVNTQTLYLPKGWMLRLVDELSCPSCGRAVRIYHADWLNPGLRFICQGCHIDLLSFEQTQWHRVEVPLL
jgi:hypothetical protein